MARKLTTFVSHGKLRGGKLVMDNIAYFRTVLSGFEDTDKVRVVIQKDRGTKTNRQLGYYFGVVLTEIATHTGHSVEELDSIFKTKYLKQKLMWRGGDMQVIQSKARLTSEEMGNYIASVILEANELGITIPDPDKGWDIEETTYIKPL